MTPQIREVNPDWIAEVVPNPDAVLVQPGDLVASADSMILDNCGEWVSPARALVGAGVSDAFVADLR